MRIMSSCLVATAAFIGLALPASAHPGGHGHLSFSQIAAHLLSEPFHALAVVGGAGLAFGLGMLLLRRKAVAAQAPKRSDNETR